MAVALTLEGCSLALATISMPLAAPSPAQAAADAAFDPEAAPDLLPAPLPPPLARAAAALEAVQALASPSLPFAALPVGTDALRVVAPKAATGAVYKALRAQAASLGIVVGDVKSCISLQPLPPNELEAAAAAGVVAALAAAGWHRLDEDRLLQASPLAPAPDGAPQACGSLTLRVRAPPGGGGKLTLLVKAEQVEFRHPACRPPGAATLAERSARLAGAPCRLLPDLRPALVERLRPADAPTLAHLRPLWAAYGQALPAEVEQLAEVRLDCDPDAPTFPYPPCRLLGQDGLASRADKLAAPPVQAVLARLRDDLAATPLKIFGDKLRVAPIAREWHPEGPPPAARSRAAAAQPLPALTFTTALQLAEAGKGGSGGGIVGAAAAADLHLGAELAVADWTAGAAGAGGDGGQQRQRRQYAPVPPALQAAFDEAKRQQAEAERPAGTARPSTAAGSSAAPAAAAAPARQPLALRQAAAAAAAGGGSAKPAVPQFKKAAAPAGTAAAKKAAGAGQKRAAAGKPPPAPKRPKAAKATAAATLPASTAAPDAAAAGASQAPPPSAGAASAGPSAGAGPLAAGPSAAAGAAPKAAAKPRKKAADIDVAAATAKVLQAHAAGKLGSLTIPELKAYLKSVKAPLGGKKGDLEERVRQRLGNAGGGVEEAAGGGGTAAAGVAAAGTASAPASAAAS